MRLDSVEAFAHNWIAAWNAHDVDRILSHYDKDVLFTSPYVARLRARPDGRLSGIAELRSYVGEAFERVPDLDFTLEAALTGIDSVCLVYRNHRREVVAETMSTCGETVTRALVHYQATAVGR